MQPNAGIGDAETHYNNGVLAAITQFDAYGDVRCYKDLMRRHI